MTPSLVVPASLDWLRAEPTGQRWLAGLPAVFSDLCEQWSLAPDGPVFYGSHVSCVVPVLRQDEPVVLKIQWPHHDCEHEALALRLWDGDGAVRLLAHDESQHALLVERCTPGTTLGGGVPCDSALDALIGLLPRLWKPAASQMGKLAVEAPSWASVMVDNWESDGRPCDRRLVDAALDYCRDLPASQGSQVVVHQDLHGHNVLASEREPWLVIDPKPLAGEREFSLAPIIRSPELGDPPDVLGRLDRLTGELGLDRERARGWAVAQSMAWSFGTPLGHRHHVVVRQLLDGV